MSDMQSEMRLVIWKDQRLDFRMELEFDHLALWMVILLEDIHMHSINICIHIQILWYLVPYEFEHYILICNIMKHIYRQ